MSPNPDADHEPVPPAHQTYEPRSRDSRQTHRQTPPSPDNNPPHLPRKCFASQTTRTTPPPKSRPRPSSPPAIAPTSPSQITPRIRPRLPRLVIARRRTPGIAAHPMSARQTRPGHRRHLLRAPRQITRVMQPRPPARRQARNLAPPQAAPSAAVNDPAPLAHLARAAPSARTRRIITVALAVLADQSSAKLKSQQIHSRIPIGYPPAPKIPQFPPAAKDTRIHQS